MLSDSGPALEEALALMQTYHVPEIFLLFFTTVCDLGLWPSTEEDFAQGMQEPGAEQCWFLSLVGLHWLGGKFSARVPHLTRSF